MVCRNWFNTDRVIYSCQITTIKEKFITSLFVWLNIIITLFTKKFQTGFLIIMNTKIYVDDTKRKDNYYVYIKIEKWRYFN